ncbi:MAG: hypothetical protein ACTSRI_16310 [Promethearchaeota archaeon]
MTTREKIEFKELYNEITKAKKHVLGLKCNWDDNDSPSFNQEQWKRAIDYLKELSKNYFSKYKLIIQTPKILPVADTSVDITWSSQSMDFTINFPHDLKELPCFYGKDTEGNELEGIISTDNLNSVILLWLRIYQ